MKTPVSITAIGSLSPLGTSEEVIYTEYLNNSHCIKKHSFGFLAASLSEECEKRVAQLQKEGNKYQNLDRSVLYAILAARKAVKIAGWESHHNFGINIGSSRGATALFEYYHQEFLENGKVATLSSPTTTLGNISSWVAHDLQTEGPEISHSITCSTALHALLNGIVWLSSGMKDKFLVGGSEAALTPFTIAQMKALKIYANQETAYPCQALNLEKDANTMVLGEGAAMACLESGKKDHALAIIEGIGYATEPLKHNISISTDAICFQKSMKMALGEQNPDTVDVVVMHAPGTIKGDISEFNAIKKIFCNKVPYLTTNKWKIGHTFGASGMLSIEMATLMLQYQQFIAVPFIPYEFLPKKIDKVLINAVGFGGNAVSVLLSRS
ncbi:beta-ketoacyl synthase N-terminal-like domain-containing protein [Ascidiimonas sp. W6]|uniref:beta-ketoacyl synthase N-terminal-like domain-containing protein n=1 Tax=Ascidiimonas meishanensis TaxID=3128903 RepID=UPI0030ED1E50